MSGPIGKVPEGLLSRKECIELLSRQAVHQISTYFSKSGCIFCAAWRKRATLFKARAMRGRPVEGRVQRIRPPSLCSASSSVDASVGLKEESLAVVSVGSAKSHISSGPWKS